MALTARPPHTEKWWDVSAGDTPTGRGECCFPNPGRRLSYSLVRSREHPRPPDNSPCREAMLARRHAHIPAEYSNRLPPQYPVSPRACALRYGSRPLNQANAPTGGVSRRGTDRLPATFRMPSGSGVERGIRAGAVDRGPRESETPSEPGSTVCFARTRGRWFGPAALYGLARRGVIADQQGSSTRPRGARRRASNPATPPDAAVERP